MMKFVSHPALVFITAVLLAVQPAGFASAAPAHGIAMHGTLKYGPDFEHFDYANPDAPRGGRIAYANIGTFDSMNPFIIKGDAPRGLSDTLYGRNVYETLLTRGRNEAFSMYALVARAVEMPDDRTWVEFTLDERAKFSDGHPIDVDDVIFSINLLREHGRPNYRRTYSKITAISKTGARKIRFDLGDGSDRELPLILSLMPVLPEHAIDVENFVKSSLTPILGSGPYTVKKVLAGRTVVLERNRDYWGRDLPVNRGRHNFDEIRIEYFRDYNTMFEAFKQGGFDVFFETKPDRWHNAYDFAAVHSGRVIKDAVPQKTPQGMRALVFNTRRDVFADVRVREALGFFFDFEWANKNLFHGLYRRTTSFFEASELSSHGVPASARERDLLAPFAGAVRDDIMNGTYSAPVSDGSGRDRTTIGKGLALLAQAGYRLNAGRMVHEESGAPLTFEVMQGNRDQQNVLLAFQRTLAQVGIAMTIRTVDASQAESRKKSFDFDMMIMFWPHSLSPGNEQNFRWHSKSADILGSWNFAGAKSAAIDAMIDALLAARTRDAFIDAVRAYDRVLLSGFYVIPLFHIPDIWAARWSRIARPQVTPLLGYQPTTWWSATGE